MNEIFATVYEWGYYSASFSEDIFQNGQYSTIGFFMLISSGILAGIYYYLIDHPSFSRYYHWGAILLVNFVINYFFTYVQTEGVLSAIGQQYPSGDYRSLALDSSIIASIVFVAFSYAIRRWSTNCRNTPIPQ